MKRRVCIRCGGMTLLELIVVLAILGIFLGSVSSLFSASLRASVTSRYLLHNTAMQQRIVGGIVQELLQSSTNEAVPRVLVLDEGRRLWFRKFEKFLPNEGRSVYSTPIEIFRDPKDRTVVRLQGSKGEVIGSDCALLHFERLPTGSIRLSITISTGKAEASAATESLAKRGGKGLSTTITPLNDD